MNGGLWNMGHRRIPECLRITTCHLDAVSCVAIPPAADIFITTSSIQHGEQAHAANGERLRDLVLREEKPPAVRGSLPGVRARDEARVIRHAPLRRDPRHSNYSAGP